MIMLSDAVSTFSDITGFIADIFWPVIFVFFGIFFIATPYEKLQKIFPSSFSKKATKIAGVFLLLIGIIYGIFYILNVIDFIGV